MPESQLSHQQVHSWQQMRPQDSSARLPHRNSQRHALPSTSSLLTTHSQFSSVPLLSHVQLFVTPWTTAHQASLSITNSQNPPKPMFIESVMPSNHLILCRPLLLLPSIFPSIRVLSKSHLSAPGGQSIGVSASTSVPPMNTQD